MADISQTPFVKELAANDRPTRDKALLSLRTYLSGRRTFTSLDLLKLHKGLFYCMWMCDRPLPQQSLASSLASLLAILPATTLPAYQRAFWTTMTREWTNIDVLRMEKFLLLTRRFIGSSLAAIASADYSPALVQQQLDILEEAPFNVDDMRIPNGMRFHCIDLWVDELERVGVLGEDADEERVAVLLGPLRRLAKESPTKAVRNKAKEALEDDRLPGVDKKVPLVEEGWGGCED